MNKQVQVELAKEVGFSVPKSEVLIVEEGSHVVPCYPCIVKPLESIHGGKRFAVCIDEQELKRVLLGYETNDVVLIQQFIQREEEIVIDGVSLNNDIVVPGYVVKHRDYMGGTTYSTTYSIKKLPVEIYENTKKLITAIGYKGLFGIELIVSKGKYYFVEINLRNDATSYAFAVAGMNLPYIWLLAQQGKDYKYESRGTIREINSIVEFRDINFMLKRKVGILRWCRELKNCECKYFYDKNDMVPYRMARKNYISFVVEKIKRIMKK